MNTNANAGANAVNVDQAEHSVMLHKRHDKGRACTAKVDNRTDI